MRAIRIDQSGGPDVMRVADVDEPQPAPDQVRVRVAAAGVNFIDIYHRSGQYELPLPTGLGLEGAGVVDAVGAQVDALAVGDRVAWAGQQGSYAELVCVPAGRVVVVPDDVELAVAAAVMLQGLTAHYLTRSTFRLTAEHTALVHAGAGGVGHLAIQLARAAGARVITTVSTAEKAEVARTAGAHEVIRYTDVDFAAEVARLAPDGLDVVYDSVGKDTFDRSLGCLRRRGMLVLFGQSSGPVDPVDPQRLAAGGSLMLTRPTLFDYIATDAELAQRAGELFEMLRAGTLTVRHDRTWPLDEAAEAHRHLQERGTRGKVLLTP